MMKVTLLQDHFGNGFTHVKGAVQPYPDDEAKALIERGIATEYVEPSEADDDEDEEEDVETATDGPPENASADPTKPKTPRRRS